MVRFVACAARPLRDVRVDRRLPQSEAASRNYRVTGNDVVKANCRHSTRRSTRTGATKPLVNRTLVAANAQVERTAAADSSLGRPGPSGYFSSMQSAPCGILERSRHGIGRVSKIARSIYRNLFWIKRRTCSNPA